MNPKIEITLDCDNCESLLINNIAEKILLECMQLYSNIQFSLNLIVTTNEKIRTYNKKFRNIDKATDVLSFPMLENNDGKLNFQEYDFELESKILFLGDIVISNELAKTQAKEYNHLYEREFAFLLTHGILHLLGYDHENSKREILMKEKQKYILDKVGYTR